MASGQTLDIINPSTGKLIQSLPTDTMESVKNKLTKSYALHTQPDHHLKLHERIECLEKLIHLLLEQKKDVLSLMIQEGGKPWADSEVEFDRAVQGIRIAIATVSEHTGSNIPLGSHASSALYSANTRVFPRGVVLAFSAFNHPLNLVIHQVIPAFATGCPCIVKPAPDTPLSCLALIKLMHSAGIPKDYIQSVITSDNDIAGALVESEKIAFFSFIGSAKVGWMLRSRLQPGVRCALEHGGCAPSIVTSNADIDEAAKAITRGAFYHAGQVCVSTQKVYVEKSIANTFIKTLSSNVSKLIVGDAANQSTDVGPLIRPTEATRINEWIKEAVEMGAERIGSEGTLAPNFCQPTILVEPPQEAKVSSQEIFGPVVCVYTYENFEDALSLMNSDDFAFQASIFSHDIKEIQRAFDVVDTAALMANEHTAFRDDAMPFAGLKKSGLGVGGIPYTIEEMQFEKMLVVKQLTTKKEK